MTVLRRLLIFLACALAAPAAQAAVELVDGGIPRNLATGQFQITLKVTGVAAQTYQANEATARDINEVFDLRFRKLDSATKLPATSEATAQNVVKIFVTKGEDGPTVEPRDDGFYNLVYVLLFQESDAGYMQANAASLDELTVTYELGDRKFADNQTIRLEREVYVIAAAPQFSPVAVLGSHKSLTAYWNILDQVPVLPTGSKAPTSVTVVVVDSDVTTLDLPAKSFTTETGQPNDQPVTCTYRRPGGDSGACVECPERTYAYLDVEALRGLDGIKVETRRNGDGAASFSGLRNEHSYYVFMQYQPDGVQRSECVRAVPLLNKSLTELNGEGEARVVDARCFIATAAYDSPLHADLGVFRRFRDEALLDNPLGRPLVAAYYAVSPLLADLIAESESLRDLARGTLSLVAANLRHLGYEPEGEPTP